MKNNIYSKKNLIVDNKIISKKLKIVDDAIVNNLLINNNLKLNRNFIVKSGTIKALEGEIVSNNNIKSINVKKIINLNKIDCILFRKDPPVDHY